MVVSTSGVLVVYAPELLRASNAELFRSTPAERPVDFTCEGFAGYTPWLSSAPVADLTPFAEMTWCAVLLAIAGLALAFLRLPHHSSGGLEYASGETPFGFGGEGAGWLETSTCTT